MAPKQPCGAAKPPPNEGAVRMILGNVWNTIVGVFQAIFGFFGDLITGFLGIFGL